MPDTRFLICLPYTLAQECPFPNDWSNPRNFSNDAHDPGGATMCGITQREYDAYRKSKGLFVQSVENISPSEGQDIYQQYWFPECPKLKPGLDLEFFDTSVNEGAHQSTRILQFALGIPDDGVWGPVTEAAVANIANVQTVINIFTMHREAVYRQMRGYQYFGHGWERRSAQIGAQAAQMASVA